MCSLTQRHHRCQPGTPKLRGQIHDHAHISVIGILVLGECDTLTTQCDILRLKAHEGEMLPGASFSRKPLDQVRWRGRGLLGSRPATAWNDPENPDTCFKNWGYFFLISFLVTRALNNYARVFIKVHNPLTLWGQACFWSHNFLGIRKIIQITYLIFCIWSGTSNQTKK